MFWIILIDIVLFFTVVRYLIDLAVLTATLGKDKEIVNIPNKSQKDYQFIKGLF